MCIALDGVQLNESNPASLILDALVMKEEMGRLVDSSAEGIPYLELKDKIDSVMKDFAKTQRLQLVLLSKVDGEELAKVRPVSHHLFYKNTLGVYRYIYISVYVYTYIISKQSVLYSCLQE